MSKNSAKIKVVLPYKIGGIAIVMKNLYRYLSEQFNIEFVLTKNEKYTISNNENFFEGIPVSVITYNSLENRYYVHKRLEKVLKNCNLVIANDWLELEAFANLKIQIKLIYILHGDYEYYYKLAITHKGFIDKFVCVSKNIEKKLLEKISDRKDDILYLTNIIEKPKCKRGENFDKPLKIIFNGRLSEEKGFDILPQIDNQLQKCNVKVIWTIIGNSDNTPNKNWLKLEYVKWIPMMNNEDVLKEYCENDILILPSKAEGFPTVIAEAMFAGLVPLVTNLDSGVPELIDNKLTGFTIKANDIEAYVLTIKKLNKDRKLLEKISLEISNKIVKFYPEKTVPKYIDLILFLLKNKTKKQKKFQKPKLSRLDKKYLPNFIIKLIRQIIKHSKF